MRRELLLRPERCVGCGACQDACAQGAIVRKNGSFAYVDRQACLCCGACVKVCYAEAREIVGREVTVAEVMAEVDRDTAFYDQSGGGVTVSGGEPLLQPDFLRALLRACKERDLHTTVETCGFARWETLDRVRPFVNLFLYDVKVMDEESHRRYTGVSNLPILSNLEALARTGAHIVLRVPVVPGINDNPENIRRLGQWVAERTTVERAAIERIDLLPFHPAGKSKYPRLDRCDALPPTTRPTEVEMADIARMLRARMLREFDLQIKIG